MTDDPKIYFLSGGELALWVESGGPVMIKFVKGKDPAELGEQEIQELIGVLKLLAAKIEDGGNV